MDSIPQLWTSTSKWNILKIGFFVEICVFHHDKLQFRIGNITMLKLLKILQITQNENDSEVDKIIKTTQNKNKSFALLTCSVCHKITKIKL